MRLSICINTGLLKITHKDRKKCTGSFLKDFSTSPNKIKIPRISAAKGCLKIATIIGERKIKFPSCVSHPLWLWYSVNDERCDFRLSSVCALFCKDSERGFQTDLQYLTFSLPSCKYTG